MGKPKKTQNLQRPVVETGAASSSKQSPSEPRNTGRRLTLEFTDEEVPILQKIQFTPRAGADPEFLKQDHPLKGMQWSAVPKAISLVLLGYLAWNKAGRKGTYSLTGRFRKSLVASLGDALDKDGPIQELFTEVLPSGKPEPRAKLIFQGPNLHGKAKDKRDRHVSINQHYLPPDCVEILWDCRGTAPLKKLEDIEDLARRIRKSQGIPEPPAIPEGEGDFEEEHEPPVPPVQQPSQSRAPIPKTATELFAEPPREPAPPQVTEPEPSLKKQKGILASFLAGEIGAALKAVRRQVAERPRVEKRREAKRATRRGYSPEIDAGGKEFAFELKALPKAKEIPPLEISPPLRRIDPSLFEVPQTDGRWPDDTPLIVLGPEEAPYTWTMKNAFEGVLILGTTGSGKTSGSGDAIAESFLRNGFGGLVLTVKKDEAEHWRRLCAYCGRESDFVAVRRGGPWKLNVLSYEAQRPGQGGGLATNLVSFCQSLLGVSSRHQGPRFKEAVWEEASNELLGATFELFLTAKAGITFDALASFVQNAPTDRMPGNEESWYNLPTFGAILAMAQQRAETDEDRRMLRQAKDYWFETYAKYPSKLRASITLGVYSMLDAFRGRDIPAIISSDTNLTPESIMAGKIVVLDLPVKEMEHTGVILQSAWKYLFQTALERQGRARDPRRRPVFLWEDEGQYFFSEHDHHFQDTARSSRVSRVILSQNVHNFYKQLGQGGEHAADSVFANLNTKIFHANTDPLTNQYASSLFGTEVRMRASFTHQPPQPPKDMWERLNRMVDPPRTGSTSIAPNVEPAVRPEEFALLRNGGPENDFMVDAYITWLGLSAEDGKHFTQTTFIQNQNL